MSAVLEDNQRYAERLKTVLKLRNEPVACKLIKEGEEFPAGVARPEAQLTHCQAVFRAKSGECFALTAEDEGCHVGAAVLGMMPTPDKVASGEFHGGMGMFDSVEAAKKMIDARYMVDYKTVGEVVCPLKKADFGSYPLRSRPRADACSSAPHPTSAAARTSMRCPSSPTGPTYPSDASDAGRGPPCRPTRWPSASPTTGWPRTPSVSTVTRTGSWPRRSVTERSDIFLKPFP